MKRFDIWSVLSYVLVLGVALMRLELSHPYNFIPVFSCLLFFAAIRPMREFVLPLLAMIGVDVYLTTCQYGYAMTAGSAVTWLWYAMVLMLGAGLLRNSSSLQRVAGASLLASITFFLASNFTVWIEWNMYPRTWSGLYTCYIAALPFFRNSLSSELACSLLIFSLINHAASQTAHEPLWNKVV